MVFGPLEQLNSNKEYTDTTLSYGIRSTQQSFVRADTRFVGNSCSYGVPEAEF